MWIATVATLTGLLAGPSDTAAGDKTTTETAAIKQQIDTGHYTEAEEATRVLLAQRQEAHGPESLEVAEALQLLVRARLLGGKAGKDKTLTLATREMALRERLQGRDHEDVGRSLDNLGTLFMMRGEPAQATPYYERGFEVLTAALGPDHPALAGALNHLAFARSDAGDLEAARALLERALALQERVLGPRHPDLAKTASNLSVLLEELGEYSRALRILGRALSIWEEHPETGRPYLGNGLHNLGTQLYRMGDYTAARDAARRALAHKRVVLNPDHPSLAFTLNLLGVLSHKEADFAEARRLYDESLRVCKKAYGPDHPEVAAALSNIAEQLGGLGDHAAALQLLEKAHGIRERAFGKEHRLVALGLDALARETLAAGEPVQAQHLFERALAMREKVLGPDHPEVAGNLDGLGDLRLARGDKPGARALFERSLAVREQALGSDHPAVAFSLERLAGLDAGAGQHDAARASLERALRLREAAFGAGFPLVSETRTALATLLARLGETDAALEATLHAEAAAREQMRLTIRSLPERRALLFASSRPSGLDVALPMLTAGKALSNGQARNIVDAVIRSRALVLDEMVSRNRAFFVQEKLAPLLRRLRSARERLARLVLRGPGEEPPERYRRLLDDARKDKEQAERVLAARSLPFREKLARAASGLAEVEAALEPGDALVGYVLNGAPGSYIAFVLRPGRELRVHALGAATVVDDQVRGWREALSFEAQALGRSRRRSLNKYRDAAAALRRKIWDPIAADLDEATRVYVVPDGTLHLVNLAALPSGPERYLVETGPLIHTLTAERDLLAPPTTPGTGLLVIGGPDYDQLASLAPRNVRTARFRGARTACIDLRSRHFEPLVGAAREAADVAAAWKMTRRNEGLRLLREGAATEAAFKEQSPGRRVLHVATHGFFLGNECPSALDSAASATSAESPLLRSGLALAGANRRQEAGPRDEDGVLTAEEVGSLNLAGVEWAVLSACNTGVGDLRAGEGVFGLQRAFRVAGVRSVIMSLWPVEDRSTLAWMNRLYRLNLRDRLATAEATRQASLDVLRARRRRGESPHPFYWGGFVAAGPGVE